MIRSTGRFCFCFGASLAEYAGEYILFLFEEFYFTRKGSEIEEGWSRNLYRKVGRKGGTSRDFKKK